MAFRSNGSGGQELPSPTENTMRHVMSWGFRGEGSGPAQGLHKCYMEAQNSQLRRTRWFPNECQVGLVQTDQWRSKSKCSETGLWVKIIYSMIKAAFQVSRHLMA